MLFVLFINDIFNIAVSGVLTKLYADDLKIYTSLVLTDSSNLQDSLHNILVWSDLWPLGVNITKCHVLHMFRNNPLKAYYFDGNLIESCSVVNDIGVDIDSSLHFDKHIDRTLLRHTLV